MHPRGKTKGRWRTFLRARQGSWADEKQAFSAEAARDGEVASVGGDDVRLGVACGKHHAGGVAGVLFWILAQRVWPRGHRGQTTEEVPLKGFMPAANEDNERREGETNRACRLIFFAVANDAADMAAGLGARFRSQGRPRAARAAAAIVGAVWPAGMPLQCSRDLAPWWTSMARPLACGRPRSAAARRSAVCGGL